MRATRQWGTNQGCGVRQKKLNFSANMSEKNDNQTFLPKWLEEQQTNSWQIEILFASGFILFLLKIPQYCKDYLVSVLQSSAFESYVLILVVGTYLFSRALLIGFVVNLILRALWLGMLGVNFAFPQGINYERLNYSEYFNDKTKQQKSLAEQIIQVEKICSLSFSITVIMTLMSLGVFLLLALSFSFISYFFPTLDTPVLGYILMILFFLLSLGVLDRVVFGRLKKVHQMSRWYYPFYRVYGVLSLSFLYRKEWLTITSNIQKWKIFVVFTLYFIAAFVMVSRDLSAYTNIPMLVTLDFQEERKYLNLDTWRRSVKSRHYENLLSADDKVFDLAIQSDIVKDKFLKLFVVYQQWFDRPLSHTLEKTNRGENQNQRRGTPRSIYLQRDSLMTIAFSSFFTVYIDKQVQRNPYWYQYQHPITKEHGFVTYLSLDSIQSGNHYLELWVQGIEADTLTSGRYREIPFIKE